MTARILVVDDVDVNLRLMAARLSAEYFQVVTAGSGPEALEICAREPIDLVLLDVMMPDMDGFEVCRRLKRDPATAHLPIVLVTALDQPADRIRGLEAGADDFLTKPARDLQLFSRVKSLTRLKLLTDELRVRAETTLSVMAGTDPFAEIANGGTGGSILTIERESQHPDRLAKILGGEHTVHRAEDPDGFLTRAGEGAYDLFLIGLAADNYDPLRLCSQLRSSEATRMVPILLVADPQDELRVAKALELGASDYVLRPVDRNELLARARTQVKRRRYDERLRQTVRQTIELAVIDPLTGLYNRRFFDKHLQQATDRALVDRKPLSVLIADIDHFKRINDGWGHDAGDQVLREFSQRLRESIRGSDLACRYGGEEFILLMPEADQQAAKTIAERLRANVQEKAFYVGEDALSLTVSAGFAVFDPDTDDVASLLKRADRGLYAAKEGGRNRVVTLAA